MNLLARLILCALMVFSNSLLADAKDKKVKNVILMVSDGTRIDVLSIARFFKGQNLFVDKYMSGLVKTYSADSTIADSAPAATAMATGSKSVPQRIGVDDKGNPCLTVLEAAKLKNKAVGIVVTCEHPHATPGAFTAHCIDRRDYENIIEQQVYCGLDVMFSGGGRNYINHSFNKDQKLAIQRSDKENLVKILETNKTKILSKKSEFDTTDNYSPVWISFDNGNNADLPFSIDNNNRFPTLAQMTEKAIKILNQNQNGFFLMVEGSKVDWASHNNDPVGIINEFVSFDDAVGKAMEFAEKDSNTIVIVCADHGNGGISFTNGGGGKVYYKLKYSELAEDLHKCKMSTEAFVDHLEDLYNKYDSEQKIITEKLITEEFKNNYQFKPDSSLILQIIQSLPEFKEDNKKNRIRYLIGRAISRHLNLYWTSEGHTGEDVFLASYHPSNNGLRGVIENTDIAKYISDEADLGDLKELTKKNYIKIDLKKIPNDKISKTKKDAVLTIKQKDNIIEIPANKNYTIIRSLDGKQLKRIEYKTVNVYSNGDFFVPESIIKLIEG